MPLVTRRQPKDRPAGDRAATYDAFISYSQKADKHTAAAIRRVIQTIGTPWWKVRGLNVFLDATSLSAAPGLWQSIETKLDQSRYLILLASPEAAASHWVDREVAHFIAANGIDRLLIALTDGELAWDAAAGDFASADAAPLPPSLRGRFAEEPLWVDLRPFRANPHAATRNNQAFLHAALDLAATIRGVEKADLYSEEVRHQRRRLRLAYGIAAVVACLAIGVGVAASFAVQNERRAVVASQKATKNFGIAKSTVNRIIFDIAQGLQVTRGVRVDSVRTILSQIQVVMKQLSDAAPDDEDVKHIRVGMFSEFGSVYLKAGDTTMALASFEKGLAEARRLTALDPHQLAYSENAALLLRRIGTAKLQAGDTAGAMAAFKDALAIGRKIADTAPQDVRRKDNIAYALHGIASVYAARDDDAASLAAWNEEAAIIRQILAVDPGKTDLQRPLMAVLNNIGVSKRRTGDRKAALTAYEESLSIARRLAKGDPGNSLWANDVADDLGNIGEIRLAGGDVEGALAADGEAVAIARRLAKLDPGNAEQQGNVATDLSVLADARAKAQDSDGAIAAFKEAIAIVQRLAEADPRDMRWPRFIATRQSKIGDVLFNAKDDPAGALAAYAQSLAGRRAMAAAFPDAEEWPLGIAYVEHQIAHVALFARRFEQAATAAREALSLNPKERMPESELAYALMFLGRTDEADRLFLGNRGKTFDGEPWESVVHDDFAELRAKGLIHPHMAEIERVFGRQDIVKAAAKP